MIQPLAETIFDIAGAFLPDSDLVRVHIAQLDLPLEVSFEKRDGELQLCAALPRWRWKTVFDNRPARIQLELRPEAMP